MNAVQLFELMIAMLFTSSRCTTSRTGCACRLPWR
jgi:hypothetical protein